MKYIYSTSQMSKLSLTLHTFSITSSMAGLCYELRSLGLDNRTTLVLSNTRELDRVPKTK